MSFGHVFMLNNVLKLALWKKMQWVAACLNACMSINNKKNFFHISLVSNESVMRKHNLIKIVLLNRL